MGELICIALESGCRRVG